MNRQPRKPGPYMFGRSECPLRPWYQPSHRVPNPGKLRQQAEHRLVRGVVPNEQRCPSRKRGMDHQLAHSRSFAEQARLDLDHRLAEQNLHIAWVRRGDGANLPLEETLLLCGQAVVERDRMRLVLDEHPWVHFGEEMKLLPDRLAEVGRALLQFRAPRGEPDFGAVAADSRSGERREKLVDCFDGSSADKRNAPSRQIEQIA